MGSKTVLQVLSGPKKERGRLLKNVSTSERANRKNLGKVQNVIKKPPQKFYNVTTKKTQRGGNW